MIFDSDDRSVDLSIYHPEKALQLDWVDGRQEICEKCESIKKQLHELQERKRTVKTKIICDKLVEKGWDGKSFARAAFLNFPERINFGKFCRKIVYPFLESGEGQGEVVELLKEMLGIRFERIDAWYQHKSDWIMSEIKYINNPDAMFFERFPMIWHYREGICNNPELASIRVDKCGYFVGCNRCATLGELLPLYNNGMLRFNKRCSCTTGSEMLWYQTIGTPGSGFGASYGFCPECGHVSCERKDYAAEIHRDFINLKSPFPVVETKWTLCDLVAALANLTKCRHSPRYLFNKYGIGVLAEWDHSYDAETDEDIEFTDDELIIIVRELIALGADVNYVCEDGDTPVHKFVYHFDILKMLVVEYGADVKALDKGNFVYDLIISDERIDILKYLLEHGVDINRRDVTSWSILHWAVERRNTEMVRMILDYGADPNAQCKLGTPLHRWLDDAEIARLLLKHGADPNSRDWDNWTPLCLCRDAETARVLIQFGADPNLDLGKARTPLSVNHTNCIREGMELMAMSHDTTNTIQHP